MQYAIISYLGHSGKLGWVLVQLSKLGRRERRQLPCIIQTKFALRVR